MYALAHRYGAFEPDTLLAYHALGRVLIHNRDAEAARGAFGHGLG